MEIPAIESFHGGVESAKFAFCLDAFGALCYAGLCFWLGNAIVELCDMGDFVVSTAVATIGQ